MDLKKPRIAYIITKSNWGGAQAYVYTLATAFTSRGYDVSVLLGGTGDKGAPTGRLARELEAAGVPLVTIPAFTRDVGLAREVRALAQLYRALRTVRPDVVHLNSSKAGGIGAVAARLAGVPKIIFTSHGLAYDEDRSRFARAVIKFSTWFTFLLCHKVVVISRDTYRRARRLPFCARKIRLIYNGLVPATLLDRTSARDKLLPEHNAEDNRVWIGTIAELTRNKDLPTLIRAVGALARRGHDVTLAVIGVGEEQSALEALIESEGLAEHAHLLGFVAGARTYLKAFDIFALTSVKEGLPYVLLEAGAAECAVVATRIPGTTDIIDDSTGILATPKHVTEVADALEHLVTSHDQRIALGKALHARVDSRFSEAALLTELETLYAEP